MKEERAKHKVSCRTHSVINSDVLRIAFQNEMNRLLSLHKLDLEDTRRRTENVPVRNSHPGAHELSALHLNEVHVAAILPDLNSLISQ
jgi:hypothetical protein